MTPDIAPLTAPDDLEWCARTMAGTEPWITLRRDLGACRMALSHPAKERYIVSIAGERAGLLILDMKGTLTGYIQTICIAEHARGYGVGSQVLRWAETRIFRDSPNVFICVSSFNHDAQRLYERLGYERVGVLTRFVVADHDEYLLRKSRGPWTEFLPRRD